MRLKKLICLITSFQLLATLFLFTTAYAQTPQHGLALHGAPKYTAEFKHLDYANPDGPKGGTIRLSAIGTYDSLNPFILKGVPAAGTNLVFETLMESTQDEPFSQYGWLAESVTVAPDRGWVSYQLRREARFHDGQPVTPADVIFSFETLRDKGHPFYRSYYKDVIKAEPLGERGVKFTFRGPDNTELPLIMGQLPVFAKHAWQGKDFGATTLSLLMGSGPYQAENIVPGRSITWKRVTDWWAKDLPVNKGRYNFDTITYDYYRDATVALEAFFAHRYDFRQETTAKDWALSYTTPAVKSGQIVKQEIRNELPAGMQGFIFNTRRDLFKDKRVREALGYAFDFEWSNKNIAFGAYQRTKSYFDNSELAASGLPSPAELTLLGPYRGKIPDEIFTKEFTLPTTDGSGDIRANLRKAADLLRDAGWTLQNGKLVDKNGRQFTFEIVDEAPVFERWVQPFLRNLERLGIKSSLRIVDTAQYQNLMDDFNFDVTISVFGQSLSPGNEQRDFWSSAKADVKGSRNLIGIKDPVIDELIEKLIHAPDRASLVTATRALDRVLLWNYLVIPHWHSDRFRIAYWNNFKQPSTPPRYGLGVIDTWWSVKP